MMIYLMPGKSSLANEPDSLGCFTAPHGKGVPKPVREGRVFGVDNECFVRPFDFGRMHGTLNALLPYKKQCLFVVVPDIPWIGGQRTFDATTTYEMYMELSSHPLFAPWPLAYVAQNGAESLPIPDDCRAVFIGGDTAWKMSPMADEVIRRAKGMGKWVHVGRVNSTRRMNHFKLMRVDSVDGTGPTYAPDREKEKIKRCLSQPPLFSLL